MDYELSPSFWLPRDVNTVGLCITVGEPLISRAQTNPSASPGAGEGLPAGEHGMDSKCRTALCMSVFCLKSRSGKWMLLGKQSASSAAVHSHSTGLASGSNGQWKTEAREEGTEARARLWCCEVGHCQEAHCRGL